MDKTEINTSISQGLGENTCNNTPALGNAQSSLITQTEINTKNEGELGKYKTTPDTSTNLSPNVRYNFDKFDYGNEQSINKYSVNSIHNIN